MVCMKEEEEEEEEGDKGGKSLLFSLLRILSSLLIAFFTTDVVDLSYETIDGEDELTLDFFMIELLCSVPTACFSSPYPYVSLYFVMHTRCLPARVRFTR